MLSYIIRRLLLVIPTVIGITLLVFGVMAMSPGGLTSAFRDLQGDMRPDQRRVIQAYYNARYGLNLPWYRQYFRWLNQVSPVGIKSARQTVTFNQVVRVYDKVDEKGLDHAAVVDQMRQSVPLVRDVLVLDGQVLSATVIGVQSDFDTAMGVEPTRFDLTSHDPVAVVSQGEGWPISWSVGFKVPNLGESLLTKRPVISMIGEALPITLLLNLITIPIVYAISITTGIYAARRRGKVFDIASGTTFLALWSIPSMWAGVVLLGYFANTQYFQWFPATGIHDPMASSMRFLPWVIEGTFQRGWLLDTLWHLVLPVVCLTYGGFAFLSKLMRASVLENLSADFARTARAKGLAENVVLMRHVLANSLLPLITVAASILPGLLGGSLIIEKIFSINGMGVLMLDAIYAKDRELVMSETLVISIISLLSLLLADILYAVADPRVSYE